MAMHHNSATRLPDLDSEASAHSARVTAHIRGAIAAQGGQLPFSRFMALALYGPGLGYYSAGARKFGASGDFVTAPEVSTLFSRCLARQCRAVLAETQGSILELGAGTGIMAADMLQELLALNTLPERYAILELSAELRARQQRTLATRVPQLLERVVWLDTWPETGFRGVIVGNEVCDAMPVERFRITSAGPRPFQVVWEQDRFGWREGPVDATLSASVAAVETALGWKLPLGYESEINLGLTSWLTSLAERLDQGVILLLDYGYPRREYYHPQRTSGTLLCHYRHRVHADPLILPGLQDITASVDFTAVAEAAVAADLDVAGYTSQGFFLLGCGLENLLGDTDPEDTLRYLELTRQVKLLTLPGEMGARYKAIALTRGIANPLQGFTWYDERMRL